MSGMRVRRYISVISFLAALAAPVAYSVDSEYQADSAVADILFNYDGSEEFASYFVRDDGFVDITFARNIPNELYGKILNELKSNSSIKGVLSGKTGPVCVFSR